MNQIIRKVRDGYTYKGTAPDLEVLPCGGCGIVFAVPEDWLDRRRSDGQGFYCPNGCARVYRTTEADRLRAQVKRLQEAEARADARAKTAELRRRATKGQLTKVRRRIRNGVCPDCNRTFQDLARHMESKHAAPQEADA
jgi:NMD protein affecting ribosome stability and mRNA decay